MKSVAQLIGDLRVVESLSKGSEKPVHVDVIYVPPALHVDVVSIVFNELEDDERDDVLNELLSNELSAPGFRQLTSGLPVAINTLTPLEKQEKSRWAQGNSRSNWVTWFLDKIPPPPPEAVEASRSTFVHFYGYKGGQARSSVMSLLAKMMADDGYRVLLVDADIEAPSLDLLLGVSSSTFDQSLMGLCGWSDEFSPLPGAYIARGGGQVDLLPCRPRAEKVDLDFALFAATAPLDVRLYERAASRLKNHLNARQDAYDFVMLDHRTGIASSVLPLINKLAGPAAIFARTDSNMSTPPSELARVIRAIFSRSTEVPGAFVSFSLDPSRKADESLHGGSARIKENLLGVLAKTMQEFATADDDEFSSETLTANWVDWYLDRSLLEIELPSVSSLQKDNIASLWRLREVLGLPLQRRETPSSITARPESDSLLLSLSGAKDTGQFIHIPDFERLFLDGSPYAYIFGRKGTGKTRLLREVTDRGLGTPLLVANDESSYGALRSRSIETDAWLDASRDAKTFWWSLINVGLQSRRTGQSVAEIVDGFLKTGEAVSGLGNPSIVKHTATALPGRQVFLIDGLETLVPAASIRAYVAALFDVMGTIQNDPKLSQEITVRAFVREDLAADSVQNIEQQIEGRVLHLNWDARSILNFALSRLPYLPWFQQNFSTVCAEILLKQSAIARSGLSEQEATELLLQVFPSRIRRNNLSTATFLRLYFSDAGGDDTNRATFYPRLYLTFLQRLDAAAKRSGSPITDHRIDSRLLNAAYDEASREFINETKQELSFLLSLEESEEQKLSASDQEKVSRFIASFEGLSTPFRHEDLVGHLISRTSYSEASIRESLRRMRAIRMFEDRPGFAGWWRVGQLYKTGLKMKYVR